MDVGASTTIRRPIHEVFAFHTDWTKYPLWQPYVYESVQTSPGPLQVGTTYRHSSRFMGRRIQTEGVITDYEPDRVLAYRTTSGVKYRGRQEFTVVPEGTRLKYTWSAEPAELPRVMRLLWPLLACQARRMTGADYARLKRLLEDGTN